MNHKEFLKWEKQRGYGKGRFVGLTALKVGTGYFLGWFLLDTLWPVLKGADMYVLLMNAGPVSWWIRKIVSALATGLGVGLYMWYRKEKEYKQYLESGADV